MMVHHVLKDSKRPFVLMTFALFAAAVFEVIGIGFLIPLLGNILNTNILNGSQIENWMSMLPAYTNDSRYLLVFIVFFMLLRTFFLYLASQMAGLTSVRHEKKIRGDLLDALINAR